MTTNEQDTINSKKINYYYNEKIEVHITLKNDRFFNGLIEYVGVDFFLINDRKLGKIPVYFVELDDIEPYEVLK